MTDRKQYHKNRLIRIADMLEGRGPYADVGPVPDHKFDMQYLYCAFAGGIEIVSQIFNPRKCKTAACALGWAKSDPSANSRPLAVIRIFIPPIKRLCSAVDTVVIDERSAFCICAQVITFERLPALINIFC